MELERGRCCGTDRVDLVGDVGWDPRGSLGEDTSVQSMGGFTKGCRPSQYTDLFSLPPNPVDTLEMISEVEPPASPAAARDEPSSKQPVAEGLLTALQPFLSEALVSQVGACYQFNVILPSGTQSIYFLDLTAGMAVPSIFPFPLKLLVPSPLVL